MEGLLSTGPTPPSFCGVKRSNSDGKRSDRGLKCCADLILFQSAICRNLLHAYFPYVSHRCAIDPIVHTFTSRARDVTRIDMLCSADLTSYI